MTQRGSLLALILPALLAFAGFFYLGLWVSAHGEPAALLAFAHAIVGHGIGLAWALTNAGWPPVLGPLFVLSIVVAAISPRWRVRALYVLAVTLLCWGAADGFQHFFGRPRRDDWVIRHEHAFSYPSSHATMATGFYFLWGLLLLRSELSRRIRYGAFLALSAVTLGIIWSRLALGAHYPTDVLGGVLLGATIALLLAAVVRIGGGRLIRER
jgi:undecaprenyl-diphosphatase